MLVNNELAQRLALGREASFRPLVINKANDTTVPLNYHSPPAEVHEWLRAKGFHDEWVFLCYTYIYKYTHIHYRKILTNFLLLLQSCTTKVNLPMHLLYLTLQVSLFASVFLCNRTANSLGVLTGAQLFSLSRDELCKVSPHEGARVYSQIMVQKIPLEVDCSPKNTLGI